MKITISLAFLFGFILYLQIKYDPKTPKLPLIVTYFLGTTTAAFGLYVLQSIKTALKI